MSTVMSGIGEDILNTVRGALATPEGQKFQAQATSQITNLVTQQVTSNFKQIAVLSAYSPPYVYTGQQLSDLLNGKIRENIIKALAVEKKLPPPPPPNAPVDQVKAYQKAVGEVLKPKTLIERVKPTVIVEGSFGRYVVAPYGEADPTEWRANVRNLILMGAAGVALWSAAFYYLGYKKGQRSR